MSTLKPACFNTLLNWYTNLIMCFTFSAMAKPNKKLKVNKPAEDPKVADPEKQTMSESLHQISEVAMDDPPLEEHHVTMDSMDVNPAHAKPLSPAQPAEEAEDVIVTGTTYTEPGNPTVLSKHKGKWKLPWKAMSSLTPMRFMRAI